jgi:hypothetical protein
MEIVRADLILLAIRACGHSIVTGMSFSAFPEADSASEWAVQPFVFTVVGKRNRPGLIASEENLLMRDVRSETQWLGFSIGLPVEDFTLGAHSNHGDTFTCVRTFARYGVVRLKTASSEDL